MKGVIAATRKNEKSGGTSWGWAMERKRFATWLKFTVSRDGSHVLWGNPKIQNIQNPASLDRP